MAALLFAMSEIDTTQPAFADLLDLGTWMGRKQAFSLIAGKCSAADVECLRNIRENKRYRFLNVTWEQFCRDYAGCSRASADKTIRLLEEFGENYFRLAAVTRITPEDYRRIAAAVTEQGVCYEGETIPIEPENMLKLTQAIEVLRRRAAAPAPAPAEDSVERAFGRAEKGLQAAVTEFQRLDALNLDLAVRSRLQAVAGRARDRLDLLLLAQRQRI